MTVEDYMNAVPEYMRGVTESTEIVTPERAAKWLEQTVNFKNRRLKPTKVKAHLATMEAGRFDGIDQHPISISAKGEVLNGQHRLHAIVLYGGPVRLRVSWDVPEERYVDYDTLVNQRTVAQILEHEGEENFKTKAGGVSYYRQLSIYSATGRMPTKTIHPADALGLLDNYGRDKVDELCMIMKPTSSYPKLSGVVTLGVLMTAFDNSDDLSLASEFVDGLSNCMGLYANDPRVILQKHCASRLNVNSAATRRELNHKVWLTNTWNLWLQRKPRKTMFKDGTPVAKIIQAG